MLGCCQVPSPSGILGARGPPGIVTRTDERKAGGYLGEHTWSECVKAFQAHKKGQVLTEGSGITEWLGVSQT